MSNPALAPVAQFVVQSLTADGGASGIITIADTSLFKDFATVFLNSSMQPPVQLIVDAVLSSTTLAVRLPFGVNTTGNPTTGGQNNPYNYSFTRYNASAYHVADGATITQISQVDLYGSSGFGVPRVT